MSKRGYYAPLITRADLAPFGHPHGNPAIEKCRLPGQTKRNSRWPLMAGKRQMIAARKSRETGHSLNHLGRLHQNRVGDLEAQRFGGLAVDDQFKFRGLLDGQVAGFRAFENLVDISG